MAGIPKSKRSGGPRTSEGKVSAAKNSFKTGAYSSLVVLPNESEEDFLVLQNQFAESLSPAGIAETALIHDLTVITWKKLRLERLEQSAFVRSLKAKIEHYELKLNLKLSYEYDWLINQIEIMDDDFVAQSSAQIDYINGLGDHGISKEDFFDLPKSMPGLFALIKACALEHFKTDIRDPIPENMTGLFIYHDTHKTPFINYAMDRALERARQVIYVSEHLPEIQAAIKAIRETRLLNLMQQQGVMRANDELSRAYFKTLNELRKQQQWRLKMTAIEVES
jgi:hypothetical protein